MFFWVKRSVPENFQLENCLGLLPTGPLHTQDSENVVRLGGRASVSKLQRLKIGQKQVLLRKIRADTNQSHSVNFGLML